jgi:hypothetical protein
MVLDGGIHAWARGNTWGASDRASNLQLLQRVDNKAAPRYMVLARSFWGFAQFYCALNICCPGSICMPVPSYIESLTTPYISQASAGIAGLLCCMYVLYFHHVISLFLGLRADLGYGPGGG